MAVKPLRIAKARRQVSMWVHPEGLVKGAIFVAIGQDNSSQEDPRNVLNADKPFLVLYREQPEEVRFYNRSAIVRVEFEGDRPTDDATTVIPSRVHMMDGSMIEGDIIEVLPADHSRLYDYLNQAQERFIRIFTDNSQICMVNKHYIIQVTTPGESATNV